MALSTRMCRNSPSAQSRYTVLVDTRRHAATPFTVSSVRIRPRRAFGRVCSLGPCRLQNVSETAAELGGSCGTLRTLVYLATYCAFERIDELACVAALLAILLLENSSPVHPANFRQGSRQLAELPSCVSRMSPNRPPTSRRLPERTSRNCARQIPCTPALLASAIVCRLIRDDRVEASPALPSTRLRAPGSHLGSPRPGSRFPTGSWFRRSISRREPRQWAR